MGNTCTSSYGTQVLVGIKHVGGSSGERWIYKPEEAIKEIIIRHGDVIDSLVFMCENCQPSTRFGGEGGCRTDKVDITHPAEYLTGISGSFGTFNWGVEAIKSLTFHTNMSTYGPFGKGGGSAFSLSVEDGCSLVGFHGLSSSYLVAIGCYARPPSSSDIPNPIDYAKLSLSDAMAGLSPRNPGPFGGAFGREWDDGVFAGVTHISVHVDSEINAIRCVRIEYATAKDGKGPFWSPRHGDASLPGLVMHRICLDHPKEFLMGISEYYSPVEGMDTIRALSFVTNNGVYGPFGSQMGTYFCSPPGGKIVGLFGRAASYLHAIGVHMEYQSVEQGL